MAGVAQFRIAAAVRTAVLWMSLCMLLQHLGHHPQFTAEAEGSEEVTILRYLTLTNDIFNASFAGRVDVTNSVEACRVNGGFLVSGQSLAAQNVITDNLKAAVPAGQTLSHTFMGGDAVHSTTLKDPHLVCKRGFASASTKCIFRWNSGLFASKTKNGEGVAFYRGSLYSLPGAGPMNGYTPFWADYYPAHGQPFMISRYVADEEDDSTWYDGFGRADLDSDLPLTSYVVVCEIQEIAPPPPTTRPPIPQPPWAKENWLVVVSICVGVVLLPILILLIISLCKKEEGPSPVTPMMIRECSGLIRRGNNCPQKFTGNYFEEDIRSMGVPNSSYGDGSFAEMPMHGIPGQGFSGADSQSDLRAIMPPPLTSKPSKRRRHRGRTFSGVFSEVEVPRAEEITEGGEAATLQEGNRSRHSESLIPMSVERHV